MKRLLLSVTIACSCILAAHSQNNSGKPREIEVYKAKEIEPYKPAPAPVVKKDATAGNGTSKVADISFFIKKWKTGVTDAFYVVDNGAAGKTMVVNVNARTKPLHINSDGSYYWEAYGEQRKGRWEKTGKSDYPVVLKNAIQNRDWYVGQHNNGKNAIFIWDHDATSYTGVPL